MSKQAEDLDDIVSEARERMESAWVQDRENREDAALDLRFLAGDQWPSNIRLIREAQNRPCLTINRLPQFVNQIANATRANPPSLQAIPTGAGATKDLAHIYSGLFRQIQKRSSAVRVYSQAEFYSVACGIGHFRIITDYVDDNVFDQEIKVKAIPYPLSVFWDPDATEITRKDAEYCIVTDLISREKYAQRFPDASESDFDTPTEYNTTSDLFWSNRDAMRVAEYWTKRYKRRTIARMETGETVDITEVPHNEVSQLPVLVTREVNSHEVVQYLCNGVEVLSGPNKWAGRYLPIFPVIGQEYALEDKIIRQGLIRNARDPQQAYNYHRSAAVESIALAPRAPFLVTPAMISKFKGQWDTQNTMNRPYLLYELDNGAGPKREHPPEVPSAFIEEAKIASDEMKATTGVYDAALGAKSNEISGIAIKARESQGDNASLHYQDNLIATLEHMGAALIDLIPKIYDADRVVSIIADDDVSVSQVRINVAVPGQNGKMVKLNDMAVGEYQVAVKMGPSYATARQEAVSSLMELFQAVPQAAGVMGDIAVQNMDFPGAEEAARRLKVLLPPQLNPNPPSPEQQQQQAQQEQFHQGMQAATLQNAQATAAKTSGEAAKVNAEAQQFAQGANLQSQGQSGPSVAPPKEDPQTTALKNALLYHTVQEKAARVVDANLLVRGRQLDNARKSQVLSEPKTRPIP